MTADSTRWCGAGYSDHSGHHRTADDWFLSRHRPTPDAHVVDVGCGTGEFTSHLASIVTQGQVVGVEPDASMRAVAAKRQAPNLRVVAGTAQQLSRAVPAGSADLVVSRAVFHWIPLADYPACYDEIRTVLRPGGWLHLESGGAGNVRRVKHLLDRIAGDWELPPARVTLPDPGAVYDLLQAVDLRIPEGGVLTVAQRRAFDREQLLGFLRTQASVAYLPGASEEVAQGFWNAVTRSVDELAGPDGSYDQTFVRLDVLAQRPT